MSRRTRSGSAAILAASSGGEDRRAPRASLSLGSRRAPLPAGRSISVIVPTKNERQNLPRFLASLPPDVELILCDASDDGTPELALTVRPSGTIVLSAPGSIAAARQAGAELSSGDLLVFADADIELDPGYFARLRALMGSAPGDPLPNTRVTPFEGVTRVQGRGSRSWDAVCGPKLSRNTYARYYRLVAQAQRVAYATLGIAGASGSNMALTRAAFQALGGFRLDLRCNEDTELFLRAGRHGLRILYDAGLVVWATDHRRLRRGLVRKSVHSLVRNTLLYLVCKRSALPRLLEHDWGYWAESHATRRQASGFDSA
jgi:glycosyltransferase involved in cell wall biosynthesis